ncbi:hypothetical protein ACQEVZ_01345 [Dactylosporangium sp. CA-152071]|uniref:hypothetical protein n=1 Tax=Dactylosporangium sp. CA-152071 TaxID=3239933 RepID=UPI003D9169D4
MHWSAYEVFSVLSGIVLIGLALVPSMKAKDRAWSALGGIAFAGYGFYVAGQDSGTWTFPVVIFVIPFAAVLYLLVAKFGKGSTGDGDR